MDILFLDHSEDVEEQSQYNIGTGSRFGARRLKRRPHSQQHLLLLDYCGGGGGGGDGDGASEETVQLPEYERLSQSARLSDDPDTALKNPPPAPAPEQQMQAAKQRASPPHQQKPAAWRLIEYVRSRNKSGGAASGCGSSDGDSKSSDGDEGEDGGGKEGSKEGKKDKKKKRSSWLPDPDRRWPVQGFY